MTTDEKINAILEILSKRDFLWSHQIAQKFPKEEQFSIDEVLDRMIDLNFIGVNNQGYHYLKIEGTNIYAAGGWLLVKEIIKAKEAEQSQKADREEELKLQNLQLTNETLRFQGEMRKWEKAKTKLTTITAVLPVITFIVGLNWDKIVWLIKELKK